MSDWAAKRFWSEAAPVPEAEGFAVALDGRRVKTPAKAPLVVPTEALAEAIAAEWQAQGEKIDPTKMPATRAANAAIDKVAPQFDEVAEMIAGYGATDLLCYRAEAPEELARRQAEAWDPLLDWAKEGLGARLGAASGIMYLPQDERALQRLHGQVAAFDAWRLTAFHDLVSLSGSVILGFAVTEGVRSVEEAWSLSRIDEDWQIEQWGEDSEAAEFARARRQAFLDAARFDSLCRL